MLKVSEQDMGSAGWDSGSREMSGLGVEGFRV